MRDFAKKIVGRDVDLWQTLIFRASLLLSGASLLLVLSLVGWHLYDKSRVVNTARSVARERALEASLQIENRLSAIPLLAQAIAADLTSVRLTDNGAELEQQLTNALTVTPEIGAVTVCFTPTLVPDFAPHVPNRYCPYSMRNPDGAIAIDWIEKYYDYTALPGSLIGPEGRPIRTEWYHDPLNEGSVWGPPYFGEATQEYWAGFGTQFSRTSPQTQELVVAGIVDVSLTMKQFQDLVASVDLGKSAVGYAFIVSQADTFISHPIDEFVDNQLKLSDFDENLDVGIVGILSTNSETGIVVVDHLDEKSGQSSWVFFAPISETGWFVGLVLDKEQIFRAGRITQRLRRQLIGIAIGAIAFLTFLSIPLLRAHRGGTLNIWAVSITFSVLSIAAIGYLWFLNTTSRFSGDDRDILLVDRAIAEKVAADYPTGTIEPIFVPTGIFVQSMEFVDANSILMNAIIWQKYSDKNWEARPGPGAGIPVVLTKADVIYGEEVIELYRKREDERQEVIGWHVRAVLTQQFDFSKYPFDQEDVFIRLRHKDFGNGVILTPDLISYTSTDPDSIPGMEKDDFFLAGWDVERSFFSFRENKYNTDFGIEDAAVDQNSFELYFNMGLSRRFLDPFLSHIVPIAVVALLLFAVLVIFSSREERLGPLGFSASAILAYCAALFFVVIIEHISLRSSLGAPQGIIYLEYFYFVTYGALLSISVNAILFAAAPNIRLLQFGDNFVMEVLYWPTYLGLFLVISLFVFF